jgi:hypothetical protein
MIKILFIVLILFMNCSNQRDRCFANLEEKPGLEGGNSSSICSTYIATESFYIRQINNNRNPTAFRFLADTFLLSCLKRIEEEKQCEKKSNLIPHIGY